MLTGTYDVVEYTIKPNLLRFLPKSWLNRNCYLPGIAKVTNEKCGGSDPSSKVMLSPRILYVILYMDKSQLGIVGGDQVTLTIVGWFCISVNCKSCGELGPPKISGNQLY